MNNENIKTKGLKSFSLRTNSLQTLKNIILRNVELLQHSIKFTHISTNSHRHLEACMNVGLIYGKYIVT